jgi:ABC-type lipoprotein export system ATPase subunit
VRTNWIRINDLSRSYRRGQHTVRALDGVTINVNRGEFVAVVGSSGSGKSTLLNLIAGLDTPSGGEITFDGQSLGVLSRRDLAEHRARRIGMIFQSFNLLPHQTALRNVEIGLYFTSRSRTQRQDRARAILDRLGMTDRLDHRPADLSGGEQQRVAIARALAKNPELLLADEPTGNLDQENTDEIATLLTDLNRDGMTIIMVTHDAALAERTSRRIVRLDYGRVVEDAMRPGRSKPS